ncbi:MAG: carbohydrate porin [Terriglobales bacterium]
MGLGGGSWDRPADKLGLAWVRNGISGDHRRYLALGGLGFLLGDGGLTYGHERVTEAFYNFYLRRGLSFAPDVQYASTPGYNQARGPAWITATRLHMDF